jgi:hypothetical protein
MRIVLCFLQATFREGLGSSGRRRWGTSSVGKQERVASDGVAAETVPSKTEGTFISTFDGCGSYPQRNSCLVKIRKTKATLRYSTKEVRLARRRLQKETQAFKSRYRMRSGIDATNSQMAQ